MREPELSDLLGDPPVTFWRFADHYQSARTYELRRCGDRPGWRSEAARRDSIELLTGPDQCADVAAPHRDTVPKPERRHCPLEEVGAFLSSVDERHREVGSVVGDHQPRDTPSSADVDHRRAIGPRSERVRGEGRRIDPRQCPDELPGVLDDLLDRSCAEEARRLRRPERVE